MDASKRMIEVFGKESNKTGRVVEYKTKLSNSECIIDTINHQILELENVNREDNNKLVMALDNVATIKEAIARVKTTREVKMTHVQMVKLSSRRPTSMIPSTIIGSLAKNDLNDNDISIQPYSIFPKKSLR